MEINAKGLGLKTPTLDHVVKGWKIWIKGEGSRRVKSIIRWISLQGSCISTRGSGREWDCMGEDKA